MPIDCKICPILYRSRLGDSPPYLCLVSGKIVNVNRGLCRIKPYQKKILSLMPLERTRITMTDINGNTVLEALGIDPEDIRSVNEFVTGTKDWDMTHRDVLNLDIIILDAVETSTSYGQAYLADCVVKGERKAVLIGSKILYKQFKELEGKYPLRGTIIKPGKYYTFASG